MNAGLQYRVEQFLYRHAELCDAQDWDGYLAQFDEQCEFHLPQWESEQRYTRDPKREMSLIYYPSRAGLEDRVFRIRTGKAASTVPMPRTLHQIGNVRIAEEGEGLLRVRVNWQTLFQRLDQTGSFFGHATYRLKPHGEAWLIARKHIVLLNDRQTIGGYPRLGALAPLALARLAQCLPGQRVRLLPTVQEAAHREHRRLLAAWDA
ncbi:anthranilate 1,2-dioxygenase small subunit [Pseudomonas aeruginosa]|nr:anthranilate 1,2-dioxygenase small subunit [Pseudomonas aeruginosa]